MTSPKSTPKRRNLGQVHLGDYMNLPADPPTPFEAKRASLVCAAYASDKNELSILLDMLGLQQPQ